MGIAVGRIRAMPDNVNRFIRVTVITEVLNFYSSTWYLCFCVWLWLSRSTCSTRRHIWFVDNKFS